MAIISFTFGAKTWDIMVTGSGLVLPEPQQEEDPTPGSNGTKFVQLPMAGT